MSAPSMIALIADLLKGKWSVHSMLVICTAAISWQLYLIRLEQWTVHMQAEWGRQAAAHNQANWIPNAYEIFWAQKSGKTPQQQSINP